eukprot:2550-Heterococcus_DN1.PRE.10
MMSIGLLYGVVARVEAAALLASTAAAATDSSNGSSTSSDSSSTRSSNALRVLAHCSEAHYSMSASCSQTDSA